MSVERSFTHWAVDLVNASAESWEAITAGVDLQVRTRRWRTSMCGGHVPWRGVAAMSRSHITITALVIGLLGAVAPSNAEGPGLSEPSPRAGTQ